MVRASYPMILKVVGMKVTGSNPVCASIINKLTYKHMGHPKFLSYCNNLYQKVDSTEAHKDNPLYIQSFYGEINLNLPKSLSNYNDLVSRGFKEPEERELLRLIK